MNLLNQEVNQPVTDATSAEGGAASKLSRASRTITLYELFNGGRAVAGEASARQTHNPPGGLHPRL